MATTYYQKQLESGQAFERFVEAQLARFGIILDPCVTQRDQIEIGENRFGLEIKNDATMERTGNVYIELAEKSDARNDRFIASGIYRPDNSTWYGIGHAREFLVFKKIALQVLHTNGTYRLVEIPTSRGFLLPLEEARCLCHRRFNAGLSGAWISQGPHVSQQTLRDFWPQDGFR